MTHLKQQKELEIEMEMDFPKFYKTANLECPLCFSRFSMGELIMHVKTCIGLWKFIQTILVMHLKFDIKRMPITDI